MDRNQQVTSAGLILTGHASDVRRVARAVEACATKLHMWLQFVAPSLSDGLNDDAAHVIQSMMGLAESLDDVADGNEGGTKRSEEKPVRAAPVEVLMGTVVPAVASHSFGSVVDVLAGGFGSPVVSLLGLANLRASQWRAAESQVAALIEALEETAEQRDSARTALRALQRELAGARAERDAFRAALLREVRS